MTCEQALLRAGDKDAASEPAGSEAAKFRLWVRSKGLRHSLPEPGLSGPRRDCQETDAPDLFVPTGTDKVRVTLSSPVSNVSLTSTRMNDSTILALCLCGTFC